MLEVKCDLTTDLPRHAVTLSDVSIKVTHPGAAVLTDRAAERLLPRVHPKLEYCYNTLYTV